MRFGCDIERIRSHRGGGQHVLDERVVAATDQGGVKLGLGDQQSLHVAIAGGDLQPGDGVLQTLHGFGVAMPSAFAALEQGAGAIELLGLVRRDRADDPVAMGHGRDQPLGLEPMQRFADRGPNAAGHLAKLALDQWLPLHQRAGDGRVAQLRPHHGANRGNGIDP